VTSIEGGAFEECESLTNIVIPSSVTSIGDLTFRMCSNLASVEIPEGVTSIGSGAFWGCILIESIKIPASVTTIGNGSSIVTYCPSLKSIVVDPSNKAYRSSGNCLIETATKTLIAGCNHSVIPDDGSVTNIRNWSFYHCGELQSLIIPSSVEVIGEHAFYGCNKLSVIKVPWDSTDARNANAPWSANHATVYYNYTG
jgi:hypothetical protein